MRNKSDLEILNISQNDPQAFEIFVGRYMDKFKRKVRGMIGSLPEVDDIVQEAFVKIYINAPRYKQIEGASVSSWSYAILINTCLSFCKKYSRERKMTVTLDDDMVQVIADSSQDQERMLSMDRFMSVLSKIPLMFRSILEDLVLRGKTYKETAEKAGITENALRTRISRAKKIFQEILISHHD